MSYSNWITSLLKTSTIFFSDMESLIVKLVYKHLGLMKESLKHNLKFLRNGRFPWNLFCVSKTRFFHNFLKCLHFWEIEKNSIGLWLFCLELSCLSLNDLLEVVWELNIILFNFKFDIVIENKGGAQLLAECLYILSMLYKFHFNLLCGYRGVADCILLLYFYAKE